MAALTWRNVDAPDFRASIQGKNAAAQLLGNAFSDLSSGLGQFQKNTQSEADAAALRGLIGVKDPTKFDQALAGTNLNNVSEEGLKALSGRQSQVQQLAALTQRMGIDQYAQDRTVTDDGRRDNARKSVADYFAARAIGDPETTQNIQENDQAFRNLPTEDLIKAYSGAAAADTNFRSGRDDNTNYANNQTDRTEGRAAMAIGSIIKRNNRVGDYAGQAADLDGVDPLVAAKVRQAMGYDAYDLAGQVAAGRGSGKSGGGAPSGGGGLTGIAGDSTYERNPTGAGTQAGSPFDATVGFKGTNTPVTSMSIGQALDYGSDVLIPGNKGNADLGLPPDKGSSAMGAYQITGETLREFAPKVLGDEWRDMKMTPENQDKIAQAIFEQRKDRNLGATWTSLPDKTPGAYKDVPWSQMRDIIGKGEVGNGNISAQLGGNRAVASIGSAAQGNQDTTSKFSVGPQDVAPSGNPITGDYLNAAKASIDQRLAAGQAPNASGNAGPNFASLDKAGVVAQRIIKNNPTFEPRAVIDKLTEIKSTDPKMTDAQAGDILEASITPTSSANPFSKYFAGTSNLGGDIGVNDNKIKELADEYKSGVTLTQYVNNQLVKSASAGLDSAKKAADTADAEFRSLTAEIAQRPNAVGLTRQLPALLAKREKALQKLQEVADQAQKIKSSPVPGTKAPEQKNREMNIPDPKSLAQTTGQKLPADFGLYD